jgi:Sulfatase
VRQAILSRFPSLALEPDEKAALARWLLVWVVLANLAFSLMYLVGSPPRVSSIVIFGALGLFVRRMPWLIQCAGFIAGLAYALVSLLSALFNLPIYSLSRSVVFIGELNAFNSLEYMLIGVFLAGLVVVAFLALRKPRHFADPRSLLLAASAVAMVAAVDYYMTYGISGHYKRLQTADAPFSSAVSNAGLVPASAAPPRHVLLVMVESLGVPVDNAEMRRLIFERYNDPAVRSRFEVSTGTTTYFGSTTAGEMRELCGRWDDYYALVDKSDAGCLPARLARQGFETSAYHSFDGDFFARSAWYPNVGFQNLIFRSDLLKAGAEVCGGVFPGACDRDVPRQLAARLKAAEKPQFVYWLTVNSHLPVPANNNLNVDDCERVSAKLAADYPMICRQIAIWDSIDAAIVKEITAADFPPTDILLVGDHMPPYFDRKSRVQFAPDRVPWLLLKWRGN